MFRRDSWPALFLGVFGIVVAVEEAAFEQLDGNDGKYEVKEHIDDHNIEDIFERIEDAVEHRLWTNSDKRTHHSVAR